MTMSGRKRSSDTIAAMLSSAPALAPVPDKQPVVTQNRRAETEPAPRDPQESAAVTPELQSGEVVYEATVEEVAPARPHLQPVTEEDLGEWDDPDELERFEFEASAPIVRPRRRRDPQYQTLRINAPTAKIMRLQWKAARQIDPMVSFTEFSTVVVQAGLRALKEQREREAGE